MEISSVYLAQAIDRHNAKDDRIVSCVRDSLKAMGVVVFDPGRAYAFDMKVTNNSTLDYGSKQVHYIQSTNLNALTHADLRVFIDAGSPSWGLPLEMKKCADNWLPFVYLDFNDSDVTPAYLVLLLDDSKAILGGHPDMDYFINKLLENMPPELLEDLRVWSTPFNWRSK